MGNKMDMGPIGGSAPLKQALNKASEPAPAMAEMMARMDKMEDMMAQMMSMMQSMMGGGAQPAGEQPQVSMMAGGMR